MWYVRCAKTKMLVLEAARLVTKLSGAALMVFIVDVGAWNCRIIALVSVVYWSVKRKNPSYGV
jgi:hypothetical protein